EVEGELAVLGGLAAEARLDAQGLGRAGARKLDDLQALRQVGTGHPTQPPPAARAGMFLVRGAIAGSTVESARPGAIPNYGRVEFRGENRIRIAVTDYGQMLGGVSDIYAHHEQHRVQQLRQ